MINFPTHKWSLLGLQFSLYKPTFDDVDANCHGRTLECLTKSLSLWLNKKVVDKGGPSWLKLKTAMEKIGETMCAQTLEQPQE